MRITQRTGDRCFKETGAGLLKVLMCDRITNAYYLMFILVSGEFRYKGINLCNYYTLFFYWF